MTYLVDLGFEGLEAAIAVYRKAREENGFEPDEGVVTVMVHCCLGHDSAEVRQAAVGPYRKYLFDNRDLMLQLDRPVDAIDDKTFAEMADIQFGRVFENLSLIGSFAAAHKTLDRLSAIGIGEVACLIDFVDDDSMTINAVNDIASLRQSYRERAPEPTTGSGPDLIADRSEFYDYIGTLGGFYGDEFRLVERVRLRGDRAETELLVEDTSEQGKAILVDAIISTAHAFALRPGLRAASVPLAMPAGVGSMSIGDVEPGVLTVVTDAKGRVGDIDYFDAVARDAHGRTVVELGGIAFNRLKLPPSDPRVVAASKVVHKIIWREAALKDAAPESISFVIHASEPSGGSVWIKALRDAGFKAIQADDESNRRADLAREWHIFVAPTPTESTDTGQAREVTLEIANWTSTLPKQGRGVKWAVLTRSAQAVLEVDGCPHPVSAAAWSAAFSLTQFGGETPQGVIDVDNTDESSVQAIAASLASEILPAAIRNGDVFRMELEPFGKSADSAKPVRDLLTGCRAVVLGGSGALGSKLISWLEEEGASAITSVSRSGMHGSRGGIARVAVQDCVADVAVELIEDMLRDCGEDPDNFDTIFHLAGIDRSELDGLTEESVASVFAPKLGAIKSLRGLIENAQKPLHVVLFSSLAALRGSQGQAAYSAANAAAAALKRIVHGTQHRATIVHFGPWDGEGMAAAPELDAIFKLKGIERVAPEVALRALGLMLAGGHDESVIAQFPERLAVPAQVDGTAAGAKQDNEESEALNSLRDIAPEERRAALVSRLQVMIAEALETDIDEVDAGTNLYDLGFDSLMAVELRNKLSEEYAIEVGLVVLMDAQTIDSVANRLMPIVEKALEQMTQAEPKSLADEMEIL